MNDFQYVITPELSKHYEQFASKRFRACGISEKMLKKASRDFFKELERLEKEDKKWRRRE